MLSSGLIAHLLDLLYISFLDEPFSPKPSYLGLLWQGLSSVFFDHHAFYVIHDEYDGNWVWSLDGAPFVVPVLPHYLFVVWACLPAIRVELILLLLASF